MTRKEKAFFRRYSMLHSAGKKGAMTELFEKMLQYSLHHDYYDEEELKKLFSQNGLKHFPVVKNNLYRLLLKSLHEFRDEPSNEDKVKSLIEQHDLLFSKSLLKQSNSVLMKAKKIAAENELLIYLHDVLNKERVLARYQLDAEGYAEVVERIFREQTVNLGKIKNLAEMNDLGSRFVVMMQRYPTSKVRDSNALLEAESVFGSVLLENESAMLTGTALRRFYNL